MFYNQSHKEVLKQLDSNIVWLTRKEARKRIEKYGINEITKVKKFDVIKIFFSQFLDPIVLILIFATILSFSLWENIDGIVIAAILVLNAILGFVQEYKAEKAIQLLSKLSSPHAKVMRDGKEYIISSKDLVPGDIVLFEAWDKISADVRLIEAVLFSVDESILTWESTSVKKSIDPLEGVIAIADQHNMIFSGTMVNTGRAKWVVIATWMDTQLGKIADLVQNTETTTTPLQHKLKKLWITLWIIIIAIVVIVFVFGWISWLDLFEMLFTSISLAVSAIPEWLPAVVTIVLALWVQKMYRKNVLVRKLKSIETLGSVTVICSDKTWTITKNQMTVTNIFINGKEVKVESWKLRGEEYGILFDIASNCNDAVRPNIGDPTELALLEISHKAGIKWGKKRVWEVPFDSEKKYMITEHEWIQYLKWSTESVLELCQWYHKDGKVIPLTQKEKKEILEQNSHMASRALRVLGFAYQDTKHKWFVFVGLMWMIDPPRPEVAQALKLCQQAWIRVIMITWDHKDTALAIAHQVGIMWEAMEGKELDELNDFNLMIDKINIFARVNPEHKVKILQCLQKRWEIVSMTWDGINDAPALKRADVGVAMAIKGTDVARDSADIVLVDDNFASIVNAIEYGRIMYDNIKKFVKLLLSANFDEILVISIAILVGLPLPMLPVQILRINLMTDSMPAIALWMDPAEKNIMLRKPRPKKEHILSGSWWFIIAVSIIAAAVSLFLFIGEYHLVGIDKARTMVITAAIIFELFLVFTVRSDKYNIWELKRNKYVWWSVALALGLHLIVMYTPLSTAFKFTPLGIIDRLKLIWLGSLWFVFWEIVKLVKKHKNKLA